MARILLIDDDPDVRSVMSILLKKKEYEVDTAFSREEVFKKLEQHKPGLILLDVLLSGSDGRELCKELKASEAHKDIPIIMFSAHPGAADKIDTYGADDFIPKPINTEALLEKIKSYLQ